MYDIDVSSDLSITHGLPEIASWSSAKATKGIYRYVCMLHITDRLDSHSSEPYLHDDHFYVVDGIPTVYVVHLVPSITTDTTYQLRLGGIAGTDSQEEGIAL